MEKLRKSGEDAKEEGTQKDGGTGKKKKEKKPFPSVFFSFFMFALSQCSGPDYIGAWTGCTTFSSL